MRILLTNDDGINAPGLEALTHIAHEIAGACGEVWIVAPAFEQSGVGHCISYTNPVMITKLSKRKWSVRGTPADCVIAALHDILKDSPPDLVLSGVNRGNNSAENVLYSGTLGGAMEGALQGLPSFALSQFYGPAISDSTTPFEAAEQHGANVIRRLLACDVPKSNSYSIFYNINFPPVRATHVQGVRVVPQGLRPNKPFHVEPLKSPNGRRFLWIKGSNQQVPSQPGTDASANLEGFISVTPMRANLTDYDVVRSLKDLQ